MVDDDDTCGKLDGDLPYVVCEVFVGSHVGQLWF